MDVIAFAVHLYQLRLKVRTDLGEDTSQVFNSLTVKNAATV
jgi:hypothetical protein